MSDLKKQIYVIIASSTKSSVDREKWLAPEVAELGLKHNGLDDVPLDSILVLAALFANGALDDSALLRLTEVAAPSLSNHIDALSEYDLISECLSSGKHQLTSKGESACHDIFNNVITRKRFELNRDLQNIELIYSNMSEL